MVPTTSWQARNPERQARRAKQVAALRAWLDAQALTPLAWAAGAAVVTTALFATATALRIPCGAASCPAYAGVPASILETAGMACLLAGLAAVGSWIAHLTQRTWIERLHLHRTELSLDGADDRLRRLDAVLGKEVVAIHARARRTFWTGLPTGLTALLLLPAAIGVFGDTWHFAAYMLPVVLLCAVAGLAAAVRGLVLGLAARRLTRPLRDVAGSPQERAAQS